MILQEYYTLANGVEIPRLGLGTWFINDGAVARAVNDAVKLGYRHIDTAQAYQNERGVGEGIRGCGVAREELFVTTKLAAEIKSYDEATASIEQSIQTLGLDYIDLMIIHSPKPWRQYHLDDPCFEGNRQAWRALEDAYKAGKLRAIGLSNFVQTDLDNILASCTVTPMVNQILVHISNTPMELIGYAQDKGMVVEAYSPIAHGELTKNEKVAEIAKQYGVSVPQLSIRYCLELGLLPLPKTADPTHMKDNAAVDFVITPQDMEILKGIDKIKDYGEFSNFPVFGGELR
ncbi:MAG: aldo/keto reductase [Desulfopila sp.]